MTLMLQFGCAAGGGGGGGYMYKEKEFRERCAARGLDLTGIEEAVSAVAALEADARGPDGTLATARLEDVERHIAFLVGKGEADEKRILSLARYFLVAGVEAITIRLLAYLLPIGVLPAMSERLAQLEGPAIRDRIMAGVAVPAPCSAPEAYPAPTKAFVETLEAELGTERARRVLMWNVHGIPAAGFAEEREHYRAAPSIQAWLTGFHERQVAVLAKHAESGTLWYEQKITPRVVDFVRDNPEILGGVVEGDRIYLTKIPYDPDRYLGSKDSLEKRRLACHCPLAVATITETGADVPPIWCYCSAGYEKFIFDVVFDTETEAEVLESVLSGSSRCRYAVKIPEAELRAKAGS